MLFDMQHIAPYYPRHNITHSVVVTKLLMLIPGSILPALGGPLADLVRIRLIIVRNMPPVEPVIILLPLKDTAI